MENLIQANKKINIYWIISIVAVAILVLIFIFSHNFLSSKVNNTTDTQIEATTTPSDNIPMFKYIEIIDGCDSNFKGTCVNMRSGPGMKFPVINRLRTGIVLKVSDTVINNNQTWYKIKVDDKLYYPERVNTDWYVGADGVRLFEDDGIHNSNLDYVSTSSKRIVVSISKQSLSAYDGDKLFIQVPVSTGLEFTPTTIGTFHIFKMTPTRYMQGPIPGSINDQSFDLPGVPWDMYFTKDGQVIH
jgi:hypothetical protein